MNPRNFFPEKSRNKSRELMATPSFWPSFFENFFPSTEELTSSGVRIYEENNQLVVEVPLPGIDFQDIDVTLNKGVLWVKGESKEEEKDQQRKFYHFAKRSYSTSIVLPTQIDEKQEPKALYEDGILKINLQLARQAETKKIQVKQGNNKKEKK